MDLLGSLLTIVALPFLVVIGATLVAFFIYLVVTIYNGIKDFFYWLQDIQVYKSTVILHTLCNLCAVIDYERGKVITAYWNDVDDNHDTLDLSRYDKNLQIIKR